jgi:hypothetical protein
MKVPGGDGEVPRGGFMAYTMPDAHLNPRIYTDPEVFDPDRYGPGREEDKREPFAYLGWGVGKWLWFCSLGVMSWVDWNVGRPTPMHRNETREIGNQDDRGAVCDWV